MTKEKKAVEAAPEDVKPEEVKAPKKAKQSSFDVYNKNGDVVRTYSVEVHGENAEDLASEYAKKLGGEVK